MSEPTIAPVTDEMLDGLEAVAKAHDEFEGHLMPCLVIALIAEIRRLRKKYKETP